MTWDAAAAVGGIAILLASMGCSGVPRGQNAALTRFPIGIYQVEDPRHLAQLKEDGFDSFLPYTDDPARLEALAGEASLQGMRMIASPVKVLGADSATTRKWPMDAWYLFDEPDVAGMSTATLRGLSDKVRAWDPQRPHAFVIGRGAAAKLYGGIGDILMMDWYPVPHRATDSVADEIDLVISALPKEKPFWMVVQAYDWADEISDPVKRNGLRFPNHAEIRFMSYVAVVHGARGLYYFALSKKGKTLFDYPELWQSVSRVSREMRGMQPVFERGRLIPLPFPPHPDGVEAKSWRYRGRDYVVILNRKGKFYQKIPQVFLGAEWTLLHEVGRNPRDLLLPLQGAWYLRPYQVMVFESRLNWLR